MIWKLGHQLFTTVVQESSHANDAHHVRQSYPTTRLFDLQQFHVEYKLRISRYARYGLAAVCEMSGDCETTFAAYRHASNANVPAFNHLTYAEFESEGASLFVC